MKKIVNFWLYANFTRKIAGKTPKFVIFRDFFVQNWHKIKSWQYFSKKMLQIFGLYVYTMRPTVCWRPTECWFLNFSLLKKISCSNHDDFHSILFSDNVRTDITGACWVKMNFFYIFLFHNSKMHWFWNANFGKCDPTLSDVGNKSAKGGF